MGSAPGFLIGRHDRSGYLWQGKYKKILLENDAHFLYIPYYIHLNPLDFMMKEWREGKIVFVDKAIKILSNYRWSSYQDYSLKNNFNSIITKDLLSTVLGDTASQTKQILNIITNPALAQISKRLEK